MHSCKRHATDNRYKTLEVKWEFSTALLNDIGLPTFGFANRRPGPCRPAWSRTAQGRGKCWGRCRQKIVWYFARKMPSSMWCNLREWSEICSWQSIVFCCVCVKLENRAIKLARHGQWYWYLDVLFLEHRKPITNIFQLLKLSTAFFMGLGLHTFGINSYKQHLLQKLGE